MRQTSSRRFAATEARFADRQREALRIRSETAELIVGTRRAIAQSHVLMAEADALIARRGLLRGALPQRSKIAT